MVSLRKAVFTNLRPDSVAWNHGSLRSFKPGFESQPGRHILLMDNRYLTIVQSHNTNNFADFDECKFNLNFI